MWSSRYQPNRYDRMTWDSQLRETGGVITHTNRVAHP
jgi:hypothetical protein